MLVSEAVETLRNLTNQHISNADIARALNLTAGGFQNRLIRKSEIKLSELEILEKHYGVSIIGNAPDDCIEIDYIHISPSCGRGTAVLDEPEVTPVKLGTQLIQTILKISDPKNLKTFKASGDSMESVIEDGDLLLVDTGRTDFANGGIFLLTIIILFFISLF